MGSLNIDTSPTCTHLEVVACFWLHVMRETELPGGSHETHIFLHCQHVPSDKVKPHMPDNHKFNKKL
jgi:hypothetical protein